MSDTFGPPSAGAPFGVKVRESGYTDPHNRWFVTDKDRREWIVRHPEMEVLEYRDPQDGQQAMRALGEPQPYEAPRGAVSHAWYRHGYQAAMTDVVREYIEGGTPALIEWVRNNTRWYRR